MVKQSSHQVIETFETTFIQKRLSLLQHFLGLGGLIFIYESWLLWMPQKLYPQVPFFSGLTDLPESLPTILAYGIAICLLMIFFLPASKKISRLFLCFFVLCSVASILLNQHRFQTWMYHLIVTSLILAWAPPKLAIRLLRIFIITIYFYSAISKMDVTFPELTGRRILLGIFKVIDYDSRFMDPTKFRILVFLFPIGEFITAVFLSFRKTRFWGLLLTIVMHSILLITFSPLGLNHQHGVLIWNIYFIIQNVIIFRADRIPKPNAEIAPVIKEKRMTGSFMAIVLTTIVAFIPLLEPWGYLDHWPAWGLYASRQERVRISIHESVASKLNPEHQKYLEPAGLSDQWRRLRIHEWSLDTLKAPMYPQDRFQTGVAIAVGEKYDLGNKIRLERKGVADRWSGKRSHSEYEGLEAIKQYAGAYRLNASPSTFP